MMRKDNKATLRGRERVAEAKSAPAPGASVVDLTNALVHCDEHLGSVEHENATLRERNVALEGRLKAESKHG